MQCDLCNMIKVFAGKVRKTGFFQKAGFPGLFNSGTEFLAFTITKQREGSGVQDLPYCAE